LTIDIGDYKKTVYRSQSMAPTLSKIISKEKDVLTCEEFCSKISTWLNVLDSDLLCQDRSVDSNPMVKVRTTQRLESEIFQKEGANSLQDLGDFDLT
jgi:hypothetical protein